MVVELKQLPESGELVIATIKEVTGHGAYVSLDEYKNMTAFLHISEIATGWIRNIERYVRPKEKKVLKVIRVDKTRVEVDLSLKQVSGEERKSKLIEVKKTEKADAFMEIIKSKNSLTDQQMNELQERILEKFDYLYDMFELVAIKGADSITSLDLGEQINNSIYEESSKIQIPEVEIRGILELSSKLPDGIEKIRDLLSSVQLEKNNAKTIISYVAAPKYRITINAENFKIAEKVLNAAIDKISNSVNKKGIIFSFMREDSKKTRR